MLPVLLSVITRALVTSDNCFGGVETFEKLAGTNFEPNTVPMAGVLLQQDNVALTRDCINLCKQQQRCTTFYLDYIQFRCSAYVESSRRHREHLQSSKNANLFEKICLKGISRQEFDTVCGNERLWAFERVKDTFLDGFVEKELTNMVDREECAKACLTEAAFICRSAEFDEVKRICRLSKENRRTQPQAFVYVKNSQRDYIENQCAPAGPASCVYTTKSNTNVFSMDSLQFASSSEDCQLQCDRETSFNCRAYGFINNRCMLSSDDEKTIGKHPLIALKGAIYGERTCVAELCTNGIFTYEKITGHVLRSAITTPVELPEYSLLGVTNWCRESCDLAQLNCPAFTVNYKNSRCERLDRNTQGRTSDLIDADGESYFEKICLRVPQIMSQCQDKFWAFERVLGYELAPVLYVKTLNFVQSRRDCQEYCLQEREFPCRSALYNDETTECKLSPEDRRTSPGHYYRSRSMKINYLENQCVRIHSSCPYQRTSNAYPTYTDIVETSSITSSEACEKLCNDNRYFLCRSYAFYSSNSQCFLSGDDSVSAGSSFVQHRSNIMYYERQCSKLPTFNANQTNGGDASPFVDTSPHTNYPLPPSPSVSITPFSDRIGESSTISPPTPDIDAGNLNKEVVIINGTVGGIITTKITRFPESLLPTLSPPITSSPKPNLYPIDSGPSSNNNNLHHAHDIPATENTDSLDNRYNVNYSPNKKCSPNARFLFEKVTSFEPIGGHLTLLYTDLQNPGIVTECARRCEHSSLCRAFVIDYYHQTCHGLFENSSVGLLDLRLSMGKDYFEGFCVPNYVHCDKFWPFDRIIDQAVVGARPEEIVRFVSRSECRTRCLEEKKFRCSSASYNSFTHECHLYSEERDSGTLNLQFTKGIDFMENQCVIDVKSCRYHSIERDISIVSVTKSVRGTSTFHCEQACDYEKEFNCRSYTYLDNPDGSIAPGGNLCLLSADNRATSHQGSIQFRPRALYAEKDCVYRRNLNFHSPSELTSNQQDSISGSPNLILTEQQSPTLQGRQIDQSGNQNQHIDSNQQQQYHQHQNETNVNSYRNPLATYSNMVQLQHIPHRCLPEEYSFEKTFGYDLRYAQRERAPIAPRSGLANFCKDECIRRGDRCLAFTIEYGAEQNQNCYFLSEAASENRNQLNKFIGTSYNEKICLREKTCDSTWAFERIIGYTMDDSPDREINSIMFRTACQDLCLLEKSFSCRSLTYDYGRRICRLFTNTRRSKPQAFRRTSDHVDYFENKCIKELSTCQYRDFKNRYLNYVDKISIATSLVDCQRQCDSEHSFHCKSVNYNPINQECALSSEDSSSLQTVGGESTKTTASSLAVPISQGSIFSEKGNCEQVTVQCNQQDMMLTLNFDSPFYGRIYTKNNPSQCYVNGNGQLKLQFTIPLDSRCGTYQESTSSYLNEVIVQQHSVIMTDNDRTIRVLCSFEISDQTITLGNVEQQKNVQLPLNGIDVSSNLYGRSYADRKFPATIVANTAAPPSIVMRIQDHTGKDAQVVSLGDDLILRIELRGENHSPYAIFARNLYARSSNGESLFLIDNNGCPIDSSIFPALQLDSNDHRSLYSKFKAFRFPSTGVVNFEVQIRFCQDFCEPVKCTQLNSHVDSFGRRRRRRSVQNSFQELILKHSKNEQKTNQINIHGKHNISERSLQNNRTESNDQQHLHYKFLPYIDATNNNDKNINEFLSLSTLLSNDKTTNAVEIQDSYTRTRSNKTGFIYPSTNYRYYRNSSTNDVHNQNDMSIMAALPTIHFISHNHANISFIDKNLETNNDNEKHFESPNYHPSLNQLESNINLDSNQNYQQRQTSANNNWDLSPKFQQNKTNENNYNNKDDNVDDNIINETNNENNSKKNINKFNQIVNAVLPLPTSATEVPLSLAIMVDDDDDTDDKTNDGDITNNEFDDQAPNGSSEDVFDGDNANINLNMANDNRHNLQYADMAARLETRNSLHVLHDKTKTDLPLICSDFCTNTGIIIFITTLVVTIVHLTLGASVYLYITKLKQSRKLIYQQRMLHSSSNFQIPVPGRPSSSPICTLARDDFSSLNEDTLTQNAVFSFDDPTGQESRLQTGYEIQTQKPLAWFGNDDEQQQKQQQNFGSIRSSFNHENIFFGPREQRFFGINNYAFPSTNNHHNNSRTNLK